MHADHITGLGALRDKTHCITVMGEQTKADVVSMRLADGDKLTIEGLALDVIYTPGHTDNSYSFIMPDRVFTGDTLLIRGTGRTDFQNGDPRAQYESIFGRLLKLPEATLVYPAHDYKGDTVSTIGEEKAYNPRLQVKSVDEYVALMNSLNLPNPEDDGRGDPGQHEGRLPAGGDRAAAAGRSAREQALGLIGKPDVALIDLRERTERERHGIIPGSLHVPYPSLAGKHQRRRHAARARQVDQQAHPVLLRVRRALGDGGAGRAGRRPGLGLPYPGRHRRLEEGQWPAEPLNDGPAATGSVG